MIEIEERLRLHRRRPTDSEALPWYQEEALVYLVDRVKEAYSLEKLQRMYDYLERVGELYTIEVQEEGDWKAIGDVTFSPDDLPIVIGDRSYRGHGIGKKIIQALIIEARKRGYAALCVREIYQENQASQKCFIGCGFRPIALTEHGASYCLVL